MELESQTRPVWDCHRTADQARGGAMGVNGAAYMAVPWSVWELCHELACAVRKSNKCRPLAGGNVAVGFGAGSIQWELCILGWLTADLGLATTATVKKQFKTEDSLQLLEIHGRLFHTAPPPPESMPSLGSLNRVSF